MRATVGRQGTAPDLDRSGVARTMAGPARPPRVSCNAMDSRRFDLLTLALLPGIPPRVRAALLAAPRLDEVFARPGDHGELLPEVARKALAAGQARKAAEQEM